MRKLLLIAVLLGVCNGGCVAVDAQCFSGWCPTTVPQPRQQVQQTQDILVRVPLPAPQVQVVKEYVPVTQYVPVKEYVPYPVTQYVPVPVPVPQPVTYVVTAPTPAVLYYQTYPAVYQTTTVTVERRGFFQRLFGR